MDSCRKMKYMQGLISYKHLFDRIKCIFCNLATTPQQNYEIIFALVLFKNWIYLHLCVNKN